MVKKTLLSMAIAAAVVSLAGCNVSTTDKYDNKIINEGVQYGPASSVYPIFAPEAGQVPLAIDFLFADAADSDGTANTADTTPPVTTALNKLDGFSTVAPLYIEFSADLDPSTVVAGQSVFLVKLRNGVDDPSIDALNIDTILASNPTNPFSSKPITPASYEARYITMDDGRTPAIQILLKEPLEPKTKYLVVLTDGIKGTNGETIGQSTTYAHAIGSDEIVNPDLAPVRGALQGWQQLAQGFLASGTPLVANAKGKAVFNYAFTTGGTDDVLKAMAAPGTFLTAQMPTYMHAEGAITQKAVAIGVATAIAGLGADPTPEQIAAATAAGTAGGEATAQGQFALIAQGVGQKLNAANVGNPNWTDLPLGDGAALRTMMIDSDDLRPYYYAGLITTIADGQGAGLDTAVDKPQTRTYQAIVHGPATPVAVPYDNFFTAQVAPKVTALIIEKTQQENPSDLQKIGAAEGIIAASVGSAAAEATLNGIALQTANVINAGAGSEVVPTTNGGADARAVFKNTSSPASIVEGYVKGLTTAIVTSQVASLSSGGAIYQGGLSIPNYLPASEAGKADSALGTWVASADAATALGLDAAPTDVDGSTNVTYRFPFAKNLGMNTVPVMATLPDATACTKPADGYPVVIYQHGITVDRTAGVLVGNALATSPVCTAMVAIDHTMHGVAPGNATGLVFSTEKVASSVNLQDPSTYAASPFAAVRAGTLAQNPDNWMKDLHERHNNVGKNAAQANVAMVFKNEAGATATADVGASGDLYINLNNFARTRDAMRQTVLDLMNLNATIGDMDVDADGNSDFDASKVYFVGHSLGAIIGTTFVAVNNDPDVQAFNGNLPKIQGAILGNGGGGVVKLLENSPSIGGAKILPGLKAAAGLEQGSADIEKFFGVMQAMVDSADPINFAGAEHMKTLPILSYEAVGGVDDAKPDLVVPNNALDAEVATAKSYLAGTDPLVTLLGIETQFDDSAVTLADPDGVRVNVRVGTGDHSTFSNADPQETFAEIYGQIGSFILQAGKAVQVTDNSVLAPAAE